MPFHTTLLACIHYLIFSITRECFAASVFYPGLRSVTHHPHLARHVAQHVRTKVNVGYSQREGKKKNIHTLSSGFYHLPTATTYSVNAERRALARFAVAINSPTVEINSSVVSGVKDTSPS